ncbi:alpha-methylacyl-CoA racemase [Microdochium nivale]|nr:alpha-methylacyl-CoA racemase [Microdochium nivale]
MAPNDYVLDLWTSSIITLLFATGAFALRFSARRLTGVHLWWDDWFVIIAYFFGIGFNVSVWVWIVQSGLGRHILEVPGDMGNLLRNSLIHNMVAELTYAASLGFVKFSILAFYWRMFKTSPIKIPIIVLFVLSAIWLTIRTIMTIFHCIPVHAFWTPGYPGAVCIDGAKYFTASTSAHLGLDILIMALPVFQIGQLQLKRTQRWGVSLLFTFGILTCIASICLLTYSVVFNPKTTDLTYDLSGIIMWASVEVNFAIIAACLPLLRPIFARVLRRLHIGSSNNKSNGGDYQDSRPKSFVRIGTLGRSGDGGGGVSHPLGRSKAASDDADSTYELAKSPMHADDRYPDSASADTMERAAGMTRGYEGRHGPSHVIITGVQQQDEPGGSGGWGRSSPTPPGSRAGGIMVRNEMSVKISRAP